MTILVTGATGSIGRRVVDHLIRLGAKDIRALTKDPVKADLPTEVTPFVGYLGDPDSLDGVFDGVDRMYLAPLTRTLGTTLKLARAAGVDYLVALSGSAHWQAHSDTVAASGIAATQLDPGEFFENLTGWAGQIAATGTVREPYPRAGAAPIAMDDIARVAATLLAAPDPAHHGEMYPITGPETLTRAETAERLGAGIGQPVRFEQCSRAEAEERLRATKGDYAGWYLDLLEGSIEHPQQANGLVAELTGVPATTVTEWAARNAALFRP